MNKHEPRKKKHHCVLKGRMCHICAHEKLEDIIRYSTLKKKVIPKKTHKHQRSRQSEDIKLYLKCDNKANILALHDNNLWTQSNSNKFTGEKNYF